MEVMLAKSMVTEVELLSMSNWQEAKTLSQNMACSSAGKISACL